jgi:uncharacterized repeat protein (TIGR01451 family)
MVSEPVFPTTSRPVSELPIYEPEYLLDREINPRLTLDVNLEYQGGLPGGVDPLLAVQQGGSREPQDAGFVTPILNIAGQGYTGVNPPDTEGDVGPDHYVQVINSGGGGIFTIYNKSNGAIIAGPIAIDSLGSGACASGLGDGIVLYDQLANRWLLSEFAYSGNHLCVYISVTPDPTGSWYAFDFTTPSFPDYPKYAVWPDAYYVSTNESSGPAAYALNRGRMLQGLSATFQRFSVPRLYGFGFQALTPSDVDGPNPPPIGAPNYYVRHRDDEVHNPGSSNPNQDYLEIWQFHVDFNTPANSTFTGPTNVPIAEIDSDLCGLTSFYCFPQPGSNTTLDPLREVVMWRAVYRNFGTHQTLVGNLVTDVDGTNHGGVRWFELRQLSFGSWSLFQQGTYAPDAHHRWMGSIAMDGQGNMALGYSVSSSALHPSIRYVGRLATDPLGVMTHGEVILATGSAANSSNRWGDYSSMHIDPADDCTFWFTNMYSPSSHWATRIAAFKFSSCGTLDFALSVVPVERAVCAPDNAVFEVSVAPDPSFPDPVTLSVDGTPAETTLQFSANPVSVPGVSELTIGNTEGAAAGRYDLLIRGASPGAEHSSGVRMLLFSSPPVAVTLLQPPNGSMGISSKPQLSWAMDPTAYSYDLQIAADPDFATIIESVSGVRKDSYTVGVGLPAETLFYWRVRANNPCGAGEYSPTFSFRTMAVSCVTYSSSDVPQAIPFVGKMTSQLVVPVGGEIIDVNVVGLTGTHSWVGDLVFWLDGPSGTRAQLLNRICSSADAFDLNLDDEAPYGSVPCPPTGGGTYRPAATLSRYDGRNSIGPWTLVIEDVSSGNGGELAGWGLEICTRVPTEAADLVLNLNPLTGQVAAGDPVSYTIGVVNHGPDQATKTAVVHMVSSAVNLVSASPTQGVCQLGVGKVFCDLGTLLPDASVYVSMVVVPTQPGTVETVALVGSLEADAVPVDNQAASQLTVVERRADLRLSKEDSSDPARSLQPLTYTLAVLNQGPQSAAAVRVTDTLPSSVNLLSWVTSQGQCEHVAGRVTCDLGTLPSGQTAEAHLVVIPTEAGTLFNAAVVTAVETDPYPADNTASQATVVTHVLGQQLWLPIVIKP